MTVDNNYSFLIEIIESLKIELSPSYFPSQIFACLKS
jgi:hypothetical protein